MRRARSSAAALAGAAFLVAGCGGGGDGKSTSSFQSTSSFTRTAPPSTPTAATPPTTPTATAPSPVKPPTNESTVPGGSEPARTELTFTGSRSGIKPRRASVAPFVAVRVSLVSADRSAHKLVISGHTLRVGGTRKSEFVELPGLRPGKSYTAKADGSVTIRILSSAEPGP